MLKFYFHQTPNPMKVALYIEEANLSYELVPVDTKKGEQHTAEFRVINPNAKAPAIEDDGVRVFDSNAILLYLSEKTGLFAGKAENRGELLSWLMFIASGLGPFSGQSVHFRHFSPEKIPYAINRYLSEAQRHYKVLDAHLEGRKFIVGEEYSIVDIAAWGWIDKVFPVLGQDDLALYPHLKCWFDSINARPAVLRARNIDNDIEFKSDFDEEAARALFPQNFTTIV
jgi:GST-like protein